MAVLIPAGGESIGVFIAGLFLVAFVVQGTREIPRWRWIAAVGLLVAVLAVGLAADDGQTVLNACYGLERYSPEWWFLGCWYLDLLGW